MNIRLLAWNGSETCTKDIQVMVSEITRTRITVKVLNTGQLLTKKPEKILKLKALRGNY